MSIFLTGSSGFVGNNVISYFDKKGPINKYKRGTLINIQEDIVIHLAGKAHDFKNVTSYSDYYLVNTKFTNQVFDSFIASNAKVFIMLSSVKAAADKLDVELTEDDKPNPVTHYGKSKLLAENYILSKPLLLEKRIYILRPCMIHGPGNKGNLNLLYKIVKMGIPWPLGAFDNKRSFCSIDNLCFVINELIQNDQIPSGVYNIADDESLSTNELIKLISESLGKKPFIWHIPKIIVKSISKIGDLFRFPLNTERLGKLTENYIVSNKKIKLAIKKPFPVNSKDGLIKTFHFFNQ